MDQKRHGCLTAWLVMIIIVMALAFMYLLLNFTSFSGVVAGAPVWLMIAYPLLAVLNVLFAIRLLQWKRSGFWGILVTSLLTFALNLSLGAPLFHSLTGLAPVAVLFVLLHIGGAQRAWPLLD